MSLSRRTLLRGAAGAVGLGALAQGGPSRAAGGLNDDRVPGSTTDYNVLEIFFAGALSHRETWWVEYPEELPVVRRIDALDPSTNAITRPVGAPSDWTSWLTTAGTWRTDPAYRMGTVGGAEIRLGPCAEPLVRPNASGDRLTGRLRVVAVGHELAVHEPAQAYMLQGQPSRSLPTRASGVAAAIARHSGLRSFVLYDGGLADPTHAGLMAAAHGMHGAENAPVRIPYDDPSVVGLLGAPRSATRDLLAGHYADRYADGQTFAHPSAAGVRARSKGFERYLDSLHAAFDGPGLAAALGNLSSSSAHTLWDNGTRRAIQTATAILGTSSRYCCVVDGGVVGDSFGGFSRYDMHDVGDLDEHAAGVTANVLNVLRTLREEIDLGRLDLDTTLVVLNTEYGRTFSLADDGSDHCSRGFAVALLGGPIPAGAGGVVGDLPFTAMDDAEARELQNPAVASGGLGGGSITGTDLRAAVLQAAGIHPIQADVYEQSELNVASGLARDDAADTLSRHLFGV